MISYHSSVYSDDLFTHITYYSVPFSCFAFVPVPVKQPHKMWIKSTNTNTIQQKHNTGRTGCIALGRNGIIEFGLYELTFLVIISPNGLIDTLVSNASCGRCFATTYVENIKSYVSVDPFNWLVIICRKLIMGINSHILAKPILSYG